MMKMVRISMLAGATVTAGGCMADEASFGEAEAGEASAQARASRPYEINTTYYEDASKTEVVGGTWLPCHGPAHSWGLVTAFIDTEKTRCLPGDPLTADPEAVETFADDLPALDPSVEAADPPVKIAYDLASYVDATAENLYWTASSDGGEFSTSWGAVRRMNKDGELGSASPLFQEEADDQEHEIKYLGLTHASVGDAFYVYWVACYEDENGPDACYIKRVPLKGEPVTLATLPAKASGPLVNDGAFLYWSDAGGIRRIPIAGGQIRTLVTFANGGMTRTVGLDNEYVYYGIGSQIRRVVKTGGLSELVVSATEVSAIYVQQGSSATSIFWGQKNAAVRGHTLGSNLTFTYSSAPGRIVTSLNVGPFGILWGECPETSTPQWPGPCTLRRSQNFTTTTLATGLTYVRGLTSDATRIFFATVDLFRYTP